MYIAPLEFPGTSIVDCDAETARDATALLQMMSQGVADAAIALSWFESERPTEDLKTRWRRSQDIRDEASDRLSKRSGVPRTPEAGHQWAMDLFRTSLEVAVERNIPPHGYVFRAMFLHARTFVFSLDAITQGLRRLSAMPSVPATIVDAHARWRESFPSVKPVRDSIHHMEDRVRGRARNRRIETEAMDNDMISAPANSDIRISEYLRGNRFGTMAESGRLEEVVIEKARVDEAQAVVQAAINAFTWEGTGRVEPSV